MRGLRGEQIFTRDQQRGDVHVLGQHDVGRGGDFDGVEVHVASVHPRPPRRLRASLCVRRGDREGEAEVTVARRGAVIARWRCPRSSGRFRTPCKRLPGSLTRRARRGRSICPASRRARAGPWTTGRARSSRWAARPGPRPAPSTRPRAGNQRLTSIDDLHGFGRGHLAGIPQVAGVGAQGGFGRRHQHVESRLTQAAGARTRRRQYPTEARLHGVDALRVRAVLRPQIARLQTCGRPKRRAQKETEDSVTHGMPPLKPVP